MNQRATFQFLILSESITVGRFPQECIGLLSCNIRSFFFVREFFCYMIRVWTLQRASYEACQTWNEGDLHRFRNKIECNILCGSWYPPGLMCSATWMCFCFVFTIWENRNSKSPNGGFILLHIKPQISNPKLNLFWQSYLELYHHIII